MKFIKRMLELDIKATAQNLTVHSVGVTNRGTAADNVVSLRWSLEAVSYTHLTLPTKRIV